MSASPTRSWMDEIRSRVTRTWPDVRSNERSEERKKLLVERGGGTGPFREAAVLIPLYVRERELWTLFTKRTDAVEHHKGQISFPGGGREPRDETLWHTAVREAEEEVGLPAAGVRPLGRLPRLVTISDYDVAPFIGAVPYPHEASPRSAEVEKILEVPLSWLMNPRVVEEVPVVWKGQTVPTLVYHYQGHTIWGATARILADLLEALDDGSPG